MKIKSPIPPVYYIDPVVCVLKYMGGDHVDFTRHIPALE
jgi:hypothetical protein